MEQLYIGIDKMCIRDREGMVYSSISMPYSSGVMEYGMEIELYTIPSSS